MGDYVVSCSAPADLTAEYMKQRDIHFVPFHFELDGKEYIALAPEDGTDDVYIYGYKQISDDEFEINEIESEEEFDAAAAEFDAIMAEDAE